MSLRAVDTASPVATLRARYQATMAEARQRAAHGKAMVEEAERMIYRLQGALTALDEIEAESETPEQELD